MKHPMVLANAIIAGTNKAGTTSLFRYLSDHPEVCASNIKEISFFSGLQGELTPQALSRYASHFAHCPPEARIRLEASANYLTGGARVARLIRECLPEVRLIFILREPVSRLLSNYRRTKERLHEKVSNVSPDDYIKSLLSAAELRDGSGPHNPFTMELKSVSYADLLSQYLAEFASDQIKILFYDDLARNALEFAKSACAFLGIDPSFYDSYQFHVENKTRTYRSKRLQRFAHYIYMRSERWLNRIPALRRRLRDVYNLVNEERNAATASAPEGSKQLRAYFVDHNRALGELLRRTYPATRLPEWIPDSSVSAVSTRQPFEQAEEWS
jgi:hypothetical protein